MSAWSSPTWLCLRMRTVSSPHLNPISFPTILPHTHHHQHFKQQQSDSSHRSDFCPNYISTFQRRMYTRPGSTPSLTFILTSTSLLNEFHPCYHDHVPTILRQSVPSHRHSLDSIIHLRKFSLFPNTQLPTITFTLLRNEPPNTIYTTPNPSRYKINK